MGYIARLIATFPVDSGYLEPIPIIGWDFNIRGFSVWASQQAETINRSLPAYSWAIHGPGTVLLPGSVPLRLPTVWGRLRKVLPGRAESNSAEIGTRATFCGWLGFAVSIDAQLNPAVCA